MNRRTGTMAAACLLAAELATPAAAQEYPARTIKMVVPFGAGGGADIVGRIVAQRMQEKLGQSVVVENRVGAGGLFGNEQIANSPKDGYTLGVHAGGQIIAAALAKNMRFDPVEAFDWVGQIATIGFLIVVRPDYPYKDIKSMVAAAKANPGSIKFAFTGFGGTPHMAAKLLEQAAGVSMLHVPYRTPPEALAALLSKNVDVMIDSFASVLGQVQSGQVSALAVTGKDRLPALANVPAAVESGVLPDYDVTSWYGLFGPRGMPDPVVAKLNKGLNELLDEDPVRERLVKAGLEVKGSTPEAFRRFVIDEHKKWNAVIEKAGLEQR